MTFNNKFIDSSSGYSIEIDDNGHVAYAYMLNPDGNIVADVWLYNRSNTPVTPEWTDPNNMPFLNCEEYSNDHSNFVAISENSEISIDWNARACIEARIIVRNNEFAVLAEGVKPGKCCMAKKDGPLATVLELG